MAKLITTNDTHIPVRAATFMIAVMAALITIAMLGGCVQINTPDKNSTSAGNASNGQGADGKNSGQNNSPNSSGQGTDAQSQQPDGNSSSGSGTNSGANPNNAAHIGIDRAKQIALEDAGINAAAATFIKEKLDYDDGREEYEIEFSVPYNNQTGQMRWRYQIYEYEIDAYSGQIISYDLDLE